VEFLLSGNNKYVTLAFLFFGAWLLWPRKSGGASTGGGRVVGIVGRMGSGKSYFGVRMAWKRIRAGANVVTNFTMKFDKPHEGRCPKKCTCKYRAKWSYFQGWEQFAYLEDAVVIIDECHLWAPSNRPWDFPTVAKWKLSMARKFKLDLYWISQHEDRVSRIIRDLTNMLYLCAAWANGAAFTAKGYEPEYFRRKNKQLDRKFYLFNAKIANLYDTLEVLETDESIHKNDPLMLQGLAIAKVYNKRRRGEELDAADLETLAAMESIDDTKRGTAKAKAIGATPESMANLVADDPVVIAALEAAFDGQEPEPEKPRRRVGTVKNSFKL
jgi:hypothetical protein